MSRRRRGSSSAAERARAQRRVARRGSGRVRRKPDKAERAAMRTARSEDLGWRWPAPDVEGVRAVLIEMGEPTNAGRCAAFLRHDCSDYERLVMRVGRFPVALRTLRQRVAAEIGDRYPSFGEAAARAADRESNQQQASLRRQMNARGLD